MWQWQFTLREVTDFITDTETAQWAIISRLLLVCESVTLQQQLTYSEEHPTNVRGVSNHTDSLADALNPMKV